MTGQRGRYEAGDATARPRPGIEAPVRPVLIRQRGVRQRAGMIAVAVVAISVFAAGIGLGGFALEFPFPSASPSASAGIGLASPSPTAPQPVIEPPRTEMPGFGCFPVDPANPPEVRLWSSSGAGTPVRGIEGPPDWALSSPPSAGWPTPSASIALTLERLADVVVVPDDGSSCIRYAIAEYLAVGDLGGTPVPLGVDDSNVNPPRTSVALGSPPPGDWIFRVVTYFSTGVGGTEDKAVVERFFRVTTQDNPNVSPEVTPAVTCAELAPGAPVPSLWVQAGNHAPVLGTDLTTYPGDILRNGAFVEGAFPERLILRVDGDVCATAWRIQWLDYQQGTPINEMVQENRNNNPYFVSQNRIDLSQGGLIGRMVISATLDFGSDRSAQAAWEVRLVAPAPPAIVVSGPGGGGGVPGVPACGGGWSTDAGLSGYESCSDYPIPPGVKVLTIKAGDIVNVTVPGWEISSWGVACGQRNTETGNQFNQSGTCDLGNAATGPIRFLPYPGTAIFQIQVGASRNGKTAYLTYYVEIVAEP